MNSGLVRQGEFVHARLGENGVDPFATLFKHSWLFAQTKWHVQTKKCLRGAAPWSNKVTANQLERQPMAEKYDDWLERIVSGEPVDAGAFARSAIGELPRVETGIVRLNPSRWPAGSLDDQGPES